MKKIITLLLAAMMLFSLAACGNTEEPEDTSTPPAATTAPPAATTTPPATPADNTNEWGYDVSAEDPVKIIFASPSASANIESAYARRMIELVEQYSEGKITFDYTEGGVMGTHAEINEGVIYGTHNMTVVSPDFLQSWLPEISVISMACLIDSYEMGEKVFDGAFGDQLRADIKDATGMEMLNVGWCGFRNVCSEKEITTLADAKDVLIRVPEVQTYIDFADKVGFSGVTMSWSEAYTSMNSGIIDAVEVPLQNIYEQGFYDLGKYVLMTRHIFTANCVFVNGDFMADLPQVYQDIIRDAAGEAETEWRAAAQEAEQGYIDGLIEKGVTINEWEPASYDELMATFSDYWTDKAASISDKAVDYLEQILACK